MMEFEDHPNNDNGKKESVAVKEAELTPEKKEPQDTTEGLTMSFDDEEIVETMTMELDEGSEAQEPFVMELDDSNEIQETAVQELDDSLFTMVPGMEFDDMFTMFMEENETEEDLEVNEEESMVITRPGSDDDPNDIALRMFVDLKRTLAVMEKVGERDAGSRNLTQEISDALFNDQDISLLTPKKRVELVTLITAIEDPKAILATLLSDRNMPQRKRLQLEKLIISSVEKYKFIVERNRIMTGIAESINKQILSVHITDIDAELATLANLAKVKKVTYVNSVVVKEDNFLVNCGNCSHNFEASTNLLRMMVHESFTRSRDYIEVFPSTAVCSECGFGNILTKEEYGLIKSRFNSFYKEILSEWIAKPRKKLSTVVNLISYIPGTDDVVAVFPTIYSKDDNFNYNITSVATDNIFDKLNEWYEETLRVVNSLPVDTPLKIDTVAVDEKGVYSVEPEVLRSASREVARMLCLTNNENYELLWGYATKTLITEISSSSMLSVINTDNLDLLNLEIGLEPILDMKNENLTEVYKRLAPVYGITMEFEEITEGNREILNKRIREVIDYSKAELESAKENRNTAISLLHQSSGLLSFLPIKKITELDPQVVGGLLTDSKVRKWIEHVADLMVINHLSDRFMKYWRSLSVSYYEKGKNHIFKNERIFNPTSVKTLKELMGMALTAYEKSYATEQSSKSKFMFLHMISLNKHNHDTLTSLESIYDYLNNLDYYSLMLLGSKLGSVRLGETEPLKVLQKLWETLKIDGNKFLTNRGKSSMEDFYQYYYGDIFTEQEIKEGCELLDMRVKKPYRNTRLQGETFADYIERLESTEYDREKSLPFRVRNDIGKYYPYVFGLRGTIVMHHVLEEQGDSRWFGALINDLARLAPFFGEEYRMKFLGLPRLSAKMINADIKNSLPVVDAKERTANFIIKNMIYSDNNINLLVDGESTDGETLESFISEDVPSFLENFDEFPHLREALDEYYSDRA